MPRYPGFGRTRRYEYADPHSAYQSEPRPHDGDDGTWTVRTDAKRDATKLCRHEPAPKTPERALGPSTQAFEDDFAGRHRAEQDKDGSASRFQQTRQPARDRAKIVDTVQRSK